MNRSKSVFLTVIFIIILAALSVALFFGIRFRRTRQPEPKPQTEVKPEQSAVDTAEYEKRIKEIDDILKDKYMVLVNADNGLDETYEPEETVTLQERTLEKTAGEQLKVMLSDAEKQGYEIQIYSAYRSYAKQKSNFENKIDQYMGDGYDREEAEKKAAVIVNPPGKSEHQTGMATDICTAEMVNRYGSLPEEFEETDEYRWLYEHCAEYGFILRYPKDKEQATGITFEPWHYRYVGVEQAKEIMSKKLCLEEYISDLKAEKESLLAKLPK